ALVRDADGKTATWLVEMGGSAQGAREGITSDSFPRGTVFSVGLAPLRSGQRGGARIEGLFKCPAGKPPPAGKGAAGWGAERRALQVPRREAARRGQALRLGRRRDAARRGSARQSH